MNHHDPIPQDMFDKAHEAFFGTTEPSPKPCASPMQLLEPQDAQNEDFGSTPVEESAGTRSL
jgi:hypothetical protein